MFVFDIPLQLSFNVLISQFPSNHEEESGFGIRFMWEAFLLGLSLSWSPVTILWAVCAKFPI